MQLDDIGEMAGRAGGTVDSHGNVFVNGIDRRGYADIQFHQAFLVQPVDDVYDPRRVCVICFLADLGDTRLDVRIRPLPDRRIPARAR